MKFEIILYKKDIDEILKKLSPQILPIAYYIIMIIYIILSLIYYPHHTCQYNILKYALQTKHYI